MMHGQKNIKICGWF